MNKQTFGSDKKKVFVSYHFTSDDLKYNGFGNYVGEFNMEVYAGKVEKFIQDIEKSIVMALEDQLKIKCAVKVLFFR